MVFELWLEFILILGTKIDLYLAPDMFQPNWNTKNNGFNIYWEWGQWIVYTLFLDNAFLWGLGQNKSDPPVFQKICQPPATKAELLYPDKHRVWDTVASNCSF